MSPLGDGGLNLPFEEGPPGPSIPLDDATFVCGVVVMAASIELVGLGWQPCLIYRFARPDGSGFLPPIAMVVPDDEAFMAVKLTQDAARAAVREAKRRRLQ